MVRLTFTQSDLLNSGLRSNTAPHADSYNINTTHGLLGRKITSLVPANESFTDASGFPAAIHWKQGQFEIGGMQCAWQTLKHTPGGWFSSTREWRWSGHSYAVKYTRPQWTAISSNSISAVFSPYRSRIFSASEPAYIEFSSDISDKDMVFLTLVMIYSETRRQEKKRSRRRQHVHAG
ncbi:hypothetical protein FPV67DRAFT_1552627 [Lyophyllum atratum]|nr:hypothetical protein FPV67DRAFT_1552627 [Lyophyllum atratum]